ncbi:hypothetical protein ROZALSC1DRAFT_25863 [Rozella allomycis CSF55]|uniref:Uncharacterized protein n=1 Tax=Rozella allomycis (strain CSF55) TaxID=988480 RepID=A0A4P9Y9S7_ROZAC|nr:hypothetical protein ROZALSC1DRAFT_25863 [Rozella allomycis CSF55]
MNQGNHVNKRMSEPTAHSTFSLEVPVESLPTERETNHPIADDAMETDSIDEVDYDEDDGDLSPKIDTSKVVESLRAWINKMKTRLAALVALRLAEGHARGDCSEYEKSQVIG